MDYEVAGGGGNGCGGGGHADDGYGGGAGKHRAAAADQADAGGSYVVRSGDTLARIAAELGPSVDQLMADDGLTDPDVLYAGQTLYY